MKWRDYVLAWDFGIAAAVGVLLVCTLPHSVQNAFCKDIYSIGISVLSIVFSVFFAALAIIITAGDNEFISFLESDDGLYTELLRQFKLTLLILFAGLMVSVALYAVTSFALSTFGDKSGQAKIWFCVFSAVFVYSLLCAAGSFRDALRYADGRVRFMKISEAKKSQKELADNQ